MSQPQQLMAANPQNQQSTQQPNSMNSSQNNYQQSPQPQPLQLQLDENTLKRTPFKSLNTRTVQIQNRKSVFLKQNSYMNAIQ